MAHQIFGNLDIQTNSSIILRETDNVSGIYLKAPASLAADLTLTFPATIQEHGVLSTNASGVLSATRITNANISDQAQINMFKLEFLTAERLLVSSAGGAITVSEIPSTVLEDLNPAVTIQSQLNSKFDLSTLTGLTEGSLLIGVSDSSVEALDIGVDGQVLKVIDGAVSWAEDQGSRGYSIDWESTDGTTLEVQHNLGTTNVIVQIFDKATGESLLVDSIVRTDTDTLDLTSSEAPGEDGWTVLVLAL